MLGDSLMGRIGGQQEFRLAWRFVPSVTERMMVPRMETEEGKRGGKKVTAIREMAVSLSAHFGGPKCHSGASITLRLFSGTPRASLRRK